MEFKPGFFGRLFTRSGNWKLSISRDNLILESDVATTSKVALPDIRVVDVRTGIFWSTVHLQTGGTAVALRGISRNDSTQLQEHLRKAISQSLGRLIAPSAKLLAAVIETLEKFYGQARYLANRDVHIWSQAQASGNLDVRKLIEILKHPFFDKALIQRDLERDIQPASVRNCPVATSYLWQTR